MAYIDTPAFDRWAKRSQADMLTGIFDQVKNDIIPWNQEVTLPIFRGDGRWRQFTVTLKSFNVMAQYEAPFADEDPQFVGAAVKNGIAQGFAAPKADLDIDLGDTYPINLEVMRIEDLDLNPYAAELAVRAFDDTDPVAKVLLDEFGNTARGYLNGVTALIPFGSQAGRVGSTVLDKLLRLAGGSKQVGKHYTMFYVPVRRFWRRPSNLTSWVKYKFVVFLEEDPGDEGKPYFEIYLTLWELILLSDVAMAGEGRTRLESDRQIKTDSKTEEERRQEEEEREASPGDEGEAQEQG